MTQTANIEAARYPELQTGQPFGISDPEPLATARRAWMEATGPDKAPARVTFLKARYRVVTQRHAAYTSLLALCRGDLESIRAELPAEDIREVEKAMEAEALGRRLGRQGVRAVALQMAAAQITPTAEAVKGDHNHVD